MGKAILLRIFLLFQFISIHFIVCSQVNISSSSFSTSEQTISDLLTQIEICRWKGGVTSGLSFTFDDNCKSHNKISKIFDQYLYKATFFVCSQGMLIDSLRDMNIRGHEIGNHTFSHTIHFSQLDSINIDFQIRKSAEQIENILGFKCLSLADPWHDNTTLSKKILFKYHLFSRDYSDYLTYQRLDIDSTLNILKVSTYIDNGIKNGSMLIMAGHGIDGDGFSPIKKTLLIQMLDLVKKHVDSGEIWVTTLKESQLYENLYHEIQLNKILNGDTLTFQLKSYNKEKYKDVAASPISINIPISLTDGIVPITNGVDIKQVGDNYILTFDLKRDTTFSVALNPLHDTKTPTDTIKYADLFLYPNPTSDFLNMNVSGDILMTEIYDLKGNVVLKQKNDQTYLNVSQLPGGTYLLKVQSKFNNFILTFKNEFIKK